MSTEQVVTMCMGTVISAVLLWVGHSVNRLNGTVAQLLERTGWHSSEIKDLADTSKDHGRILGKHDHRISQLEGALG